MGRRTVILREPAGDIKRLVEMVSYHQIMRSGLHSTEMFAMNNVLRETRKCRLMTQAQLASSAGISRRTLSSIETGQSIPSLDVAMHLAGVLEIPLDRLFYDANAAYQKKRVVTNEIRFVDLFCGIGGFRFAADRSFESLGLHGNCVFSCDIDSFAQKSYEANFGEKPSGDITKINASDIPDFDLLMGGFPCQSFSIIGKQEGFADKTRGTLFFDIARIIKEKQPQAFVLENVKQLVSHNGGKTFKVILSTLRNELGYYVDYRILNALDYGLPQKRERTIIVGSRTPFVMRWPEKRKSRKQLSQILEKDVDERYYVSQEIRDKRAAAHVAQTKPEIWHENKSGNISSYPYSCALRAGASYNYLLVDGERRLTPRELLRLQGFPESFNIVVSDCQIRKQTGNAVPVAMIQAVLDSFIPLVFTAQRGNGARAADPVSSSS